MKIYLVKDTGMLHSSGFPVYYLSTSPTGCPKKALPEVIVVEEFEMDWRRGDRVFFEELLGWAVLPVDTPARREKLLERESEKGE